MKKSFSTALIFVVATACLLAAPSRAFDTTPSTVELNFWYVISTAASTDSAYTAAFGATNIVGRLNGSFRYNGAPNSKAKYANVKFYQPFIVLDPSVTSCVQKALTVAGAQVTLGPSPTGRNAGLVMKLTGDVRLNEGNGGYDGQPDLTIIEVRSLRSLACEATFYHPSFP